MSKQLLLAYARGMDEVKQEYFVLYSVTTYGEIIIHRCDEITGREGTVIRFFKCDGTETEANAKKVSEEELTAAIEMYLKKRKRREMNEGTKVICEEFLNGDKQREKITIKRSKQ